MVESQGKIQIFILGPIFRMHNQIDPEQGKQRDLSYGCHSHGSTK